MNTTIASNETRLLNLLCGAAAISTVLAIVGVAVSGWVS